jgi:hypothetical protein
MLDRVFQSWATMSLACESGDIANVSDGVPRFDMSAAIAAMGPPQVPRREQLSSDRRSAWWHSGLS